ncbi:caspase family protein [Spirosoma panaciterrae]|uniref:caspase family protein n=1 Tax=Spirosoma panaciterrae TaxID=496058 RepID=UPI00039EBA89|nr:caspase family protein [Spirosoma panaciterrae]
MLGLLAACSLRPNAGRNGEGGSDVVQPLWQEESSHMPPADKPHCTKVVALLIGIGQYDPANGWESLSAGHDVALMSATLQNQGVLPAHIHLLTDRQATKAGIANALQTVSDTISKGTQFIFLYAGHARRLTDDSGDEVDGYDEAIVPYDAPPAKQDQPDAYLRDDELNQYLTRIRTALGRDGSLWLLFDACHSQTLNRGQSMQRMRGGIAALGRPARSESHPTTKRLPSADWYESQPSSGQMAPYVLFAAASDSGPNFETTDESGRSLGPLTRAVCEALTIGRGNETYQAVFNRVAAAMARFAPYQKPALEGNIDRKTFDCGDLSAQSATWRTTGEPIRVDWPDQDKSLTDALKDLSFVQRAGSHPDLLIARRGKTYRLWNAATNQLLTPNDVSMEECIERVRQYFARKVLLTLEQSNPDFQVKARMQRVAVRTEGRRTLITDTLPDLNTTGLPVFRVVADERMLLTLTNTGAKAAYVTIVDLQPDGTLHVLLPGEGQDAASFRLAPDQSMQHRIRVKEPVGMEVYKVLLTPEPIALASVLRMRGNTPIQHPYEALFQRTYMTRGLSQGSIALSERAGSATDLPFWVLNDK